jgi:transposase InsO family protein
MTEKYDPYENAIAERINGILKQEFGIARNIKNIDLKKQLIKSAVGTYNNFRPHLSNHMLTPVEMHKQSKLKRRQYKSKKLNDASVVKL